MLSPAPTSYGPSAGDSGPLAKVWGGALGGLWAQVWMFPLILTVLHTD